MIDYDMFFKAYPILPTGHLFILEMIEDIRERVLGRFSFQRQLPAKRVVVYLLVTAMKPL